MNKVSKCIVLDLDGTLWRGTLAEDGASGIDLGRGPESEPFLRLQYVLRELGEAGTIFAIASKNDYAEASATIESLENFLIRDYVVAMKIGWGPKSESLREIAEELAIGLDSLVFLDDSPFEREMMRRELPEVFTPELPENPEEYAAFVKALPGLQATSPTPEAARRADSYRIGARRAELAAEASWTTLNEELNAVVTIQNAASEDVARIAELSSRTNQFNMTSARLDAARLHQMLLRPDEWSVRAVRLADDLEDLGIVGAVVLRRETSEWTIDEFVISCRALSRDIESAVLWNLATEGLGAGIRHLRGLFHPTDRNVATSARVYESNNFQLVDGTPTSQEWVLDLRGELPKKPRGLRIRSEAGTRQNSG